MYFFKFHKLLFEYRTFRTNAVDFDFAAVWKHKSQCWNNKYAIRYNCGILNNPHRVYWIPCHTHGRRRIMLVWVQKKIISVPFQILSKTQRTEEGKKESDHLIISKNDLSCKGQKLITEGTMHIMIFNHLYHIKNYTKYPLWCNFFFFCC